MRYSLPKSVRPLTEPGEAHRILSLRAAQVRGVTVTTVSMQGGYA